MGAGHAHGRLYRAGDSIVHRLPPQCKLVAVVAFTLVVVATDRERFPAFAGYAALLIVVAAVAGIRPPFILRRMTVELPFVLFAVALPFLSPGPRVEVLGVWLSVDGLLAGWNILAKATLGVVASILLAATTEPRILLLGAARLRLPQLMVQIAMFMLRYADVIVEEMRRMKVARESRAFAARNLKQVPVIARSAGALFIRSYERGERVHLAMLSRGYTGTFPVIDDISASRWQWGIAGTLPLTALAILAGSLL
nr:cobalt ECF transporter T component CbiQ [Rhizohabitans arisaemae]